MLDDPRESSAVPAPSIAHLSCIVCAFNEGPRLGAVLDVATAHAMIGEVIVVDDGSSDDTAQVAARYPKVRLIVHENNRGKSQAIASGVSAARHQLLMFLDADLLGLRPEDLTALATPVLAGHAAVSLSLRRNSLALFRWIGLDFVTGERVLDKRLITPVLPALQQLPRFGVEVFLNRRIIAAQSAVSVVRWPTVTQSRKTAKRGWLRGLLAEWRMLADLVEVCGPRGLLIQSVRLAMLRVPSANATPTFQR